MGWRKDDARLVIATPDGPREVRDAYAQWVLGAGRGADPAAAIPREHPDDFRFLAACPAAAERAFGDIAVAPLERLEEEDAAPVDGLVAPLPLRRRAVARDLVRPPDYAPAKGVDAARMVIVGIIDDGINVFHRRFRPDGQDGRVEFAWLQDADSPDGATVPYGAELSRGAITRAMDTCADDAALLVSEGLSGGPADVHRPSLLDRPASHGTFVADLAAGATPGDGDARDTRLITVQLPALGTLDTSGASLMAAARHGAAFVFDRALRISRAHGVAIPVVLNFSFALSGGACDGRHPLEAAMRAEARAYRAATADLAHGPAPVVRLVPAGNGHLTRCHAVSLPGEDALDLPLRLLPDDRTPSFLEIWAPEDVTALEVAVTPPHGKKKVLRFKELRAGACPAAQVLDDGRGVALRVSVDAPLEIRAGAAHWRCLLAFAPSDSVTGPRALVTPGLWRIRASAGGAPLSATIQRDDNIAGLGPGGRQGYFDDGPDAAFDGRGAVRVADPAPRPGPATLDGTMSGLGVSDGTDGAVICVGGAIWATGAAVPYSAAAPDAARGPAVMAVAETSALAAGVLGAATLSGSVVRMGGTSAAAPQVTRMLVAALRAMPPGERSGFDALAVLRAAGAVPERPGKDRPEAQHRRAVREARLGAEGVVLGLDLDSALRGVAVQRT